MSTVIYKSYHVISFKVEKDGNKFHAFCPELNGCHTLFKNFKNNLKVIVPIHSKDIPIGTLRAILRDAKINIKM